MKRVTFETDYSVNQLTLLAGITAGHALTGGHKQALRHAPETRLSGENAYSTGRRGAGGFVIEFGGVCYQDTYPDVSCVYPAGYTYPDVS